MPASLDEAFIRPYKSNSETMTASTLSTLKNPAYHSYQTNYQISDIQSEADEIASVYNSLKTFGTRAIAPDPNPNPNLTKNQDHDCNMLVAKLLSCQKCRHKIKEILADDGSTVDDNTERQQSGGGRNGSGINLFGHKVSSSLISNIVFGILLILVLDSLFKLKK